MLISRHLQRLLHMNSLSDKTGLFFWEEKTVPDVDMSEGPLKPQYIHFTFFCVSVLLFLFSLCYAPVSPWFSLLFSLLLGRLIAVDLSYMILPNLYIALLCAIGVGNFFLYSPLSGISVSLGFLLGFMFPLMLSSLLSFLKKPAFIGGGDIKFMAVSGLYIGIEWFFTYVFIASALSLFLTFLPRSKKQIPFGPGLAFSLWICYLWQEKLFSFLYSL